MKIQNEQRRILTLKKAFPAILLICMSFLYVQNNFNSNISPLNRIERDLVINELKFSSIRNINGLEMQNYRFNNENILQKERNVSFSKIVTRKFPNAIIIGVKKCGTRALLEYLRINPNIKAAGPEPHFFDRYYHLGLEWYRQKMPRSYDGQLTIEKTPRYFITKEVPERIYNMSKTIKLILVVRNPVTRAISDFTQAVSKGEYDNTVTFQSKAIRRNGTVNMKWSAVNIGLYVQHLKRWLDYFPMESIHVVDGENLITNPVQELNAVQDFLGVKRQISENIIYMNASRGFPCIIRKNNTPPFKCFRSSKGRHHSYVDMKTITTLQHFYKPFNFDFFRIINENFQW